jgi:hypothetical protein
MFPLRYTLLLKSAKQKLIKENSKVFNIGIYISFHKLSNTSWKNATRLTLYKPIEFICKFFDNIV